MQADRATDWFGMQHSSGSAAILNFDLKSGEPAYLEVTVDPAAHGEDGLGPIKRGVSVKTASGQALEFTLTATVVK